MDYSSVSSITAREFVPETPAKAASTKPVSAKAGGANDEPFSFWDLLDIVNPLQHVPIVNAVYREATGNTIKTPMKIIGSTIIGGPIGFASAVIDGVVEEATEKDTGAHAMAMFKPAPDEFVPAETQFADAREFIPDAVATPTMVAVADAETEKEAVAAGNELLRLAALREGRATRLAAAAQPRESRVAAAQQPSEAEAMIAAAQIAAKANVRMPLPRDPGVPTTQPHAPQQVATAAGTFMPLRAAGATAREMAAPRVAAANANNAELQSLMARTKYAAGVRGNRDISPAILAQATKSRAAANPAAATSQYERARQAAAGNVPQEMPAWFDEAMKTSAPGL